MVESMTNESQCSSLTLKLTEGNFEKLSSGEKPLFVDFWAAWCGPCRIMDPIIEKLAEKYADLAVFGKVNVDEEMSISSRYEIFSIPTFMVFKRGEPTDAVIGAVGESSLEQFLCKAIDAPHTAGPAQRVSS
jgi:thioredoxin 1